MALLHLALGAAVCWTGLSVARAEEPAPHATEIRFVPAAANGTVSLGLYNREGQLVRVLCDEWTFNRFRIGLNGLSTPWDGKDDAGQLVPEGTYTARGFVVGDIAISGEAFHFNDWIESLDSPRLVSVAAQQLLPGGDILIMARLAGQQGALVRYSQESEARWRTVVAGPRPGPVQGVRQLAVSDTAAFALLDGKLRAVGLADGAEVPIPVPTDGVTAVAARGDRLALLNAVSVRFFVLPGFTAQDEVKDLPAPLVSLALLDQGAVAADAGGAVWRWQAGWSKIDMPPGNKVRAVSSGRGDTFWVLEEHADGTTAVAHYSPEEGRLAEWSPRTEGEKVISLAAAADKDYFVASLVSSGAQRTVAIRRKTGAGGWEYVFDKKITRCAEFSWSEGALVASGGEHPQDIDVRLVENPLDPGASRQLVLRAATHETGPGLDTTDGLPLLRVSSSASFQRVMVVPGKTENTARFFQGDEACVEEYSLSNLGDMTSFDAGTIKMSGGTETPAPPAQEEAE